MASDKVFHDYDPNEDWDEHLERLSRQRKEVARLDDEALKREIWSCKVGDHLEVIAPFELVTRGDGTPHPSPTLGRIYRVESLIARHFHLVPVDGVPQDDIGMFNNEILDHFKVVPPPPAEPSMP